MYMLICTMDMVVFPVLWSLLQTITHSPITQWNPLTLQGAGLFHIAMGAVLGIAAFGRTQEKLGGANNGGIQTPGTGFAGGSSTFGQPQSGGFGNSGGFGSPAPTGFGGSTGFGAPAPAYATNGFGTAAPTVVTGFGGKPAPAPAFQPEI
jgi:hypothetical protein